MEAHQWQQVRRVFEAAIESPAAERAAFALKAAASEGFDQAMREALLTLLSLDQTGPDNTEIVADACPQLLASLDPGTLAPGQQIGAWRVLRLLGRGGMGTVHLVTRASRDFEQLGAMKRAFGGWDAAELQRRFREERRILSSLRHPRIAALVDGGEDPDGRPYLVTEFVDGLSITEFCDRNRLGIDARLELFVSVCDAVAHAHRSLIVHRDIKPSNILVDPHGHVKLLDFGIAKLLETDGGATGTAARLFTPDYAAPEQIKGGPVTTRVDIHALGMLLHELLCGCRPFVSTAATATGRGIRTALRPSQAVTEQADAADRAGTRQATPRRLRARLRGDLDAIIMTALREDPDDRQVSVEALADDIRRHLRREPVAARRGDRRYRARLFLRRHALATGLAAVALLSLVGGLTATAWQAREAVLQREAARAEASKARAALGFMTELFEHADPDASQGQQITAEALLARGVERIGESLQDQPLARAELVRAMGQAHLGLGLYEQAHGLLAEARELDAHSDRTELAYAISLFELGRYPEAIEVLTALVEGPARFDPVDPVVRGRALHRIGMAQQALNQLDAAEASYEAALAWQRARFGDDHRETEETIFSQASLLTLRRRAPEALPLTTAVLERQRRADPGDDTALLRALAAQAMVVSNTGPVSLAESLRREELALAERIYGSGHPRSLRSQNNLATILAAAGQYQEALDLTAIVLEARRRQLGPDHPSVGLSANNLAELLLLQGRIQEAEAPAAEALRIRLAHYGENHHNTANALRTAGSIALEAGRLDEARALLERSVAAFQVALPEQPRSALAAINNLVRTRIALAAPDPGCALATEASGLIGPESAAAVQQYQHALLAACRRLLGEASAEPALRAALDILDSDLGSDARQTRIVREIVNSL